MAKKKSRQTYLKRQRELRRMEKAELKRQKRWERKRGGGLPEEPSDDEFESLDPLSGDPLGADTEEESQTEDESEDESEGGSEKLQPESRSSEL